MIEPRIATNVVARIIWCVGSICCVCVCREFLIRMFCSCWFCAMVYGVKGERASLLIVGFTQNNRVRRYLRSVGITWDKCVFQLNCNSRALRVCNNCVRHGIIKRILIFSNIRLRAKCAIAFEKRKLLFHQCLNTIFYIV